MEDMRLVEKLSDGSVADLFLAQVPRSSQRRVVEMVRRELVSNPRVMERFVAEAKFRRTLDHPNLARRVAVGKATNGSPYFLSEPLTGGTLRQHLVDSGPLAVEEIVKLMVPLSAAVGYLHDRGITHGNLSPDNVFLDGGLHAYRPKLVDSGLVLLRAPLPAPGTAGRTLVRPEYLSPERLGGRRGNPLSDIYALGILMFELRTACTPPPGGAPALAVQPAGTTAAFRLGADEELLASVIARCLAIEPRARFPTAWALRHYLQRLPEVAQKPSSPPPLPLEATSQGKRIGSYEIIRELGEGSMGHVFVGRHRISGRQVAIKVLRPEHGRNRGFVERFAYEARVASQIRHPHIVEIIEFVEDQDESGHRYSCVMELLTGLSLEELLRQKPVAVGRLVNIARQVCSALDAAHNAGVIHRDVKPENIFLCDRAGGHEYVKLLDFGVAKYSGDALPGADALTLHGQVVGTPAYMAPEQMVGKPVDARTDVYALGTVLYRGLTGRKPFKASSFAELAMMLLTVPAPPLEETSVSGQTLPARLRNVVATCLEKDPARRPQTMAELSDLLLPFDPTPTPSNVLPAVVQGELEPNAGFGSKR